VVCKESEKILVRQSTGREKLTNATHGSWVFVLQQRVWKWKWGSKEESSIGTHTRM
jgi:hypothetical protein